MDTLNKGMITKTSSHFSTPLYTYYVCTASGTARSFITLHVINSFTINFNSTATVILIISRDNWHQIIVVILYSLSNLTKPSDLYVINFTDCALTAHPKCLKIQNSLLILYYVLSSLIYIRTIQLETDNLTLPWRRKHSTPVAFFLHLWQILCWMSRYYFCQSLHLNQKY
jgi:hypothetical protein